VAERGLHRLSSHARPIRHKMKGPGTVARYCYYRTVHRLGTAGPCGMTRCPGRRQQLGTGSVIIF